MPTRYRAIKQWGRWNTALFKKRYMKKLQEEIHAAEVPDDFKSLGVTIYDPTKPTFWAAVEGDKPQTVHSTDRESAAPRIACRTFDGTESLADGINHALNLINAVGREGLPDALYRRTNGIALDNVEKGLKDSIMRAIQWDSTMDKLPKRRDPELWWINWPRYYGIPSLRKSSLLLDNLLRQSVMVSGKHGLPMMPRYMRDVSLKGFVQKGENLLQFLCRPYLSVWSSTLLPSLVGSSELQRTIDEPLVDISPIDPLVDLRCESVATVEPEYPIMPSTFPYINTLLLVKENDLHYPWTPKEMAANAILSGFGCAVAIANRIYEGVSGALARPVVVQCVQCCENAFDFAIVQLNSMDLAGSGGGHVKNVVWHDSGNSLYKAVPYWQNVEDVEEINADVFRKFLSLLLNAYSAAAH